LAKNPLIANYEGILKITITIDSNTNDKRMFYTYVIHESTGGYCWNDTYNQQGRLSLVIGNADKAKLYRLNDFGSVEGVWEGIIKNKLICFPYTAGANFNNAGKYYIEVTDKITKVVDGKISRIDKTFTHYFNQPFAIKNISIIRAQPEKGCVSCGSYHLVSAVNRDFDIKPGNKYFRKIWTNVPAQDINWPFKYWRAYYATGPSGWGVKKFITR